MAPDFRQIRDAEAPRTYRGRLTGAATYSYRSCMDSRGAPIRPGEVVPCPSRPRRRALLPWVALALLLSHLALPVAIPAQEMSVGAWESSELGIRLALPRGWYVAQESPDGGNAKFLLPAGNGQVALLGLPLDPDAVDAPPDLEALSRAAIRSLKESIKKFKLMSQRDLEVAGLPAREIFYKGKVSDTKVRWIQTLFVHNGRQVFVVYVAPESAYLGNVPEYDQIVRSIRLTP